MLKMVILVYKVCLWALTADAADEIRSGGGLLPFGLNAHNTRCEPLELFLVVSRSSPDDWKPGAVESCREIAQFFLSTSPLEAHVSRTCERS